MGRFDDKSTDAGSEGNDGIPENDDQKYWKFNDDKKYYNRPE